MSHLLEKASECIDEARHLLEAGRRKDARQKYLEAASFLFKAASGSSSEAKRSRLEAAWRLLRLAERLQKRAGPSSRPRAFQAEQAAEGEAGPQRWLLRESPGVSFEDVAGLDEAKREILLEFIYPARYPEQAARYGVATSGGLLLYGPPGTGKTLMARAVATEVEAAFYTVTAADIMSKWVGEAEARVKALFADARAQGRSIIFIDEIESLLPKRRGNISTVMSRVIPQFLAELDGFHKGESQILFIGATNEPWALDPAALRPGRFDTLVYVPLPDMDARKRIFEIHLKDVVLADDVNIDELAEITEGYSGADIRRICKTAGRSAFEESIRTGSQRDISQHDFLEVIRSTPPSVSRKQVEAYERFRANQEHP